MSDIKCCIKCQFCAYVQYLYLASGCGHKCVCFSPHPNARIRGYENTRIAGPQPCRWVSAGQVSVIKFVMSCRHGKGFLSAIYFISALLFLFPLSLWLAFLLAYFYGTRTAQSGIYIYNLQMQIYRYEYSYSYGDGELQLLLCSRLWHVYFCLYSISYDF